VLVKSEEERKGRSRCEQGKKDGKRKRKEGAEDTEEEEESGEERGGGDGGEKKRRSSYSAGVIRSLGFDSSIKMGQRRPDNTNSQNKVYPYLIHILCFY